MNKRIIRHVFTLIVMLMGVVTMNTTYAQEMFIEVDLSNNESNALVGIEDRQFTIWKLSDESLFEGKDELMDELAKKTDTELTAEYPNDIKSGTTNKDGKFKLTCTKGSYYAREINGHPNAKYVPFLFILKDKPITIKPKVGFYGSVEMLKVSGDETPLPGAKFELYQVDEEGQHRVPLLDGSYSVQGSTDEVLTTDNEGKITIQGLPEGEYIFKEIEAPEGYEIRDEETVFSIKVKETTTVKIFNYEKGKGGINFKKVSDDVEPQPIAGVKFLVTQKNGEFYDKVLKDGEDYVVTSDEQGLFLVDNLPYGEYYLWEVETPTGYYALSGPVKFVIDESSIEQMITIENKRIRPEKPVIPDTGDVTLFLVTILGIVIGTIGYLMVKEQNVE